MLRQRATNLAANPCFSTFQHTDSPTDWVLQNQSDPLKIWHIQQIVVITRWYKSVCKDKIARQKNWLVVLLLGSFAWHVYIQYERMPFCSVKSYLKWRGVDKLTSVVMLRFFDLSSGFRCAMFNVIKQDKRQTDRHHQQIHLWLSAATKNIHQYKSIYSIFHVVQIIFKEHKAAAAEHMDISIQSLLPHLFKIRSTAEPIHDDS